MKAIERSDLTKEEIGVALIRGLWGSLESHLRYCVEDTPPPEGKAFHRQCVREYADLIQIASKLLHQPHKKAG